MSTKDDMLALLDQKNALIEQLKDANAKDDQAAFDTAKQSIDALDKKIERTQTLMKLENPQQSPFGKSEALNAAFASPASPKAEPAFKPVSDSNHAFCECIRAQSIGDYSRFARNLQIIAQNEAGSPAPKTGETGGDTSQQMSEGVPADGGLLVPQDIQTRIIELKRQLYPLSRLFRVEHVNTLSGSRVIDVNPQSGFVEVGEYAKVPKDLKPQFKLITYTVKKYASICPISEELLKDSDQNLISYLARWFAKRDVITENRILLDLLAILDAKAVTAAAGKALDTIKDALHVTLDPAIARTASFVTNQSGISTLDKLADGMGRPLLQPNPANGTEKLLFSRTVHVVNDSALPDKAGGSPLYIGDLKQFGVLFQRQAMELESTRIGGAAWENVSTEVRAVKRMGACVMDEEAATLVLLPKA